MKKLFFSILGITLLSIIPYVGNSQKVSVQIFDCNNIKATVNQGHTKKEQSFSLEKMLAPDIWSQQWKVQSFNETFDFTNLAKGTYRISWVKEGLGKKATNLALEATLIGNKTMMAVSDFVVIDACNVAAKKEHPSGLSNNHIRIYPNPATRFFRLETSKVLDQKADLILYNGLGQKVKKISIDQKENLINLSDFSPGVYFISLVDNQGQMIHNEKLIINK